MSHAAAIQFPTRRVEEWKYSDLSQALGEPGFGVEAARAVIGKLPDGVEMFDLDEPERPGWVRTHYGKLKQNSVSAVSLALARGGIAMRVAKNKTIADPLALAFTGKGHGRALIVLEEGSFLTLVESSDGAQTRNIGVEIVLGAHARLDHIRIAPTSSGIRSQRWTSAS